MIVMNVVVGLLLLYFFWGKGDRSSTLWASGSFLFAIGIVFVLADEFVHPFVRFFGSSFATVLPVFLQVQSVKSLFGMPPENLWAKSLLSFAFSLGVLFLLGTEREHLLPVYIGIGFCTVHLWAAFSLSRINRDRNNPYIRFFFYLFIVGAIFWLIRGVLAPVFNFEIASDQTLPNWLAMFFLTALVLLRQIAYLLIRFGRTQEEKETIQLLNTKLTSTIEQKNTLIKTLATSVKANQMGGAVAGIVHELSQPLAAIGLNTDLLINTTHEPIDLAWQTTILTHIQQDNARAADIISRLRDFYTRGSETLSDVDLGKLIVRIIELNNPEFIKKNIKLQSTIAEDVIVYADKGELEMVILNLLTNALNASAERVSAQSVVVSLRTDNQSAVLDVIDNGAGISEEHQKEIFTLFHTTKSQGMGVGLWLSRVIMEKHLGAVELVSSTNTETRFQLTMPLSARSA